MESADIVIGNLTEMYKDKSCDNWIELAVDLTSTQEIGISAGLPV